MIEQKVYDELKNQIQDLAQRIRDLQEELKQNKISDAFLREAAVKWSTRK